MLWWHQGSQLLFPFISTDNISFPENLDDSFQQGLLSNKEPVSENTIQTDNLPVSQGLPKPHTLVEESKQPQLTVTSRSNNRTEETPLLDNISKTCRLGNSFILGTPQCHQKRRRLSCSTVSETHLFSKRPTAQLNNRERQIRLKTVRSYGKTPDFVQIVPETPNVNLKSNDELSLYDWLK